METFTATFKRTTTISIEGLYRYRTNGRFTPVILTTKTITISSFESCKSGCKNGSELTSVAAILQFLYT